MFESIDRLVGASKGEGIDSTDRVFTVPNAISLSRLLLIPAFLWLLASPGEEGWGIGLLVLVVASDWIDGYIARRTDSVSRLGSLLDPLSDRLVISAALIMFVAQGVFPTWTAALIIARDVFVLGASVLAVAKGRQIAVRWTGKVATFDLMAAIPLIAWGGFDLPLAPAAIAIGWTFFVFGLPLYYVAAYGYVGDLRKALSNARQE